MNARHQSAQSERFMFRHGGLLPLILLVFCAFSVFSCFGTDYPQPEDVEHVSLSPQAGAIYYGNGLAFLADRRIAGTALLSSPILETSALNIDHFYWQDEQIAAASGTYSGSSDNVVRFYKIDSGTVERTGETDPLYDIRYPFPTSTAELWLSSCRAASGADFNICLIGPEREPDSYTPEFLADQTLKEPFIFGAYGDDYFFIRWQTKTDDRYSSADIVKLDLYSEEFTDVCRIAAPIPSAAPDHSTVKYLPSLNKFALITYDTNYIPVLSLIDPEQREENGNCAIEATGEDEIVGVQTTAEDRLIILRKYDDDNYKLASRAATVSEYDITLGESREIYRWPDTRNTTFAVSVARQTPIFAVGPAILGPPKDGQNLYYILLVDIADGAITKLAKSRNQNVE